MTLKERVKNLCKNRGVSMNQLEKELEFASGYISKLDKSTPNSKNIQKIANYFNVSVDYIMTGKETDNASQLGNLDAELTEMNDKVKEYALKMNRLSEENKKYIMYMIDLAEKYERDERK